MIDSSELTLFHTGVIVDDLDQAMALWSNALGLHWAPPKTTRTPLRCPAGVFDREARFTYSLEGPHHVELLEQIDATPYLSLTGGRHIHHLGYYTRHLAEQSERLEALGFTVELSGIAEDGGVHRATFHRNPLSPGIWVELVDDSVAVDIDPWMAQAAAEQGVDYVSPFLREPSDPRDG